MLAHCARRRPRRARKVRLKELKHTPRARMLMRSSTARLRGNSHQQIHELTISGSHTSHSTA